MSRAIYLVVFSNGSKPAHWAIWIPTGNAGAKGKLMHATGNPATGFFLEFRRNYDFEDETRRYKVIELAQVSDKYIADTVGNGELINETTARDRFESAATTVAPPGKSPNPFDPKALNCQDWIKAFVEKLIAMGYIDDGSTTVVQDAPRYL
ncbi:hypothetical protein L228DRAFT_249855 [Xylona heveae TC161]|uniref:Uncharacterized protein n=1 Tax=Xylona heveae (strain CBS 132557 / TC161) TaxID=1328760 RepID=A0A165AAL8_XYLHT|nr:hypothetical protein L228DRAFT_249855 [Xylona heveae TC161]KZF20178.1 hypothetical protein L228DRAFT_249855 [Xylona heveae TC161]